MFRQVLYVLGFILGVAMFFGGAFMAVPALALAILYPGATYFATGVFAQPADSTTMFVVGGIGMAIWGGGVALQMSCFSRLGVTAYRLVGFAFFAAAASFFGWVLYTFPMTNEGYAILGLAFTACVLGALAALMPNERTHSYRF